MMTAFAAEVRRLLGAEPATDGPLRIGLDVVAVGAFARLLGGRAGTDFATRNFTPAELAFCAGRPARLAARWAAKEAVAKAIGTGFRGLAAADIEVTHHPDGRPTIAPTAGSTWPHDAGSWGWSLSLCHEGDAAIAIVAALAAPSRQTIGRDVTQEGDEQ